MAELETNALLKGTKDELTEMLNVFCRYVVELGKQYAEKHDCAFLESADATCGGNTISLDSCSAEDISTFLAGGNEVEVTADGPYGCGGVDECGLFEALADAAPNAAFDAIISGNTVGQSDRLIGKLADGKLSLEYGILTDEWIYDYAEANDLSEEELDDMDFGDVDDSDYWFIQKSIYDPATKSYEFLEGFENVIDDDDEDEGFDEAGEDE